MIIFYLCAGLMTLASAGFLVYRQSKSYRIFGLALLFFLIVAGSIYWKLGASKPLSDYLYAQKQQAHMSAELSKLGDLNQIIAQLKLRLEKNPDGRGWYLLGRLYLNAQQFPQATMALSKANQLSPHQAEILLSYAQALYFSQGASLNLQAQQLLQQVLQLQPHQAEAINLLAINAYQHENYTQAIHYWQDLLSQFPKESPEAKPVKDMISQAQQKLGALNSN